MHGDGSAQSLWEETSRMTVAKGWHWVKESHKNGTVDSTIDCECRRNGENTMQIVYLCTVTVCLQAKERPKKREDVAKLAEKIRATN